MRVAYWRRYEGLKSLVREHGVHIINEMWRTDLLHLPLGSKCNGGENGLHHYAIHWWKSQQPDKPLSSEAAKEYACFLLDAFLAYRQNHRWQMTNTEGYRIARKATEAWLKRKHVRGAIQEVT